MLSSLTSFLFSGNVGNPPNEESVDYFTKDVEGDWLIVDVEEDNKGPRERAIPENPRGKPLSAININMPVHQGPSQDTTPPPASPSQMDGSWYVTPPPCFTAGGPTFVETSPLENLLIEHPSMSVYGSRPGPKRKGKLRLPVPKPQASASNERDENKDDSNAIVSVAPRPLSPVLEQVATRHKARNHTTHIRRGHVHSTLSLTAKSGILEESRQLIEIQRQQHLSNQCKIKRSVTDRHNRTKLFHSSCKHPQRRSKLSLGNSYANNNRKCC